MSEPQDQSATLTDDDIETRHVGVLDSHADDTTDTVDDATDTGDDSGDASDTTDTGDDSGDGTAAFR